jgi:NAD(P)H-dependent FMN reductase
MNILILNASPRKNGTTVKILNSIREGFPDTVSVDWIDVNQLNMKPCIGCLKCRPDKKCILPGDDGHLTGELINKADKIIIGTPTYWGNITGPLKTLFDRNVPAFEYIEGFKIIPQQKGKEAVLVITSEAPFPFNHLSSQSRGAVKSLKTVLHSGGFKIKKTLNIGGSNNFESKSMNILRKARKIGERIL